MTFHFVVSFGFIGAIPVAYEYYRKLIRSKSESRILMNDEEICEKIYKMVVCYEENLERT